MTIGHAYLFNALFYLPAAAGILLIKTSGAPDVRRGTFSMASILGGVRFLFSRPILVALVMLDFVVTGVGYYRPLLPIFAKDILHVGPAGFGALSSAPAIGGIAGTVLLLVIGDLEHKGLLVLWSLFFYAVAVGCLAISTNFCLSLSLLGFLGLANSLQAVMRQTTFHLLTPDHLRGRAFSVFNMFSQGANSVGATEVGFVAALIGAPDSMLFGCAVGTMVTLACWAAMPSLRRFWD
jgi:predicted MFS family arabinose efflux permease